jgi:hypothetical protein
VDLNGDGHIDLISGSWPGEIFIFWGGPDRTFGKPEMLKDKNGEIINVGGGVRDDGEMLLITGNATFDKSEDGKTIVKLHGKTIQIPEGKSVGITGCASAVYAFDWTGNGVLDLLVGDIGGSVWLVPNEGTAKDYAFGKPTKLKAGEQPISVPGGDAGPTVADWDGDGLPDLIVGCGDGSVVWFRNIGTRTNPELAKAERLVPSGKVGYDAESAPKDPQRGTRAKVCVTDWNGDGKLDLLVGDFATQKPDRPEPTAEEKAEQDKLRAELKEVEKRYFEMADQHRTLSKGKDKEKLDQHVKDMREVLNKMYEIRDKLPPEYETHGWVWLFLRQAAAEPNGQ